MSVSLNKECHSFFNTAMSAAECGLALSYLAPFMSRVNQMMETLTNLDFEMVMVQRILGYTKLKAEADLTSCNPPPKNWPENGRIEFQEVDFRYHITAPNVLKHVDLIVDGGSKVRLVLIIHCV